MSSSTVGVEVMLSLERSTSIVVNSPYRIMMTGIPIPERMLSNRPLKMRNRSKHVAYRNYNRFLQKKF
jgi:hypothetical protein